MTWFMKFAVCLGLVCATSLGVAQEATAGTISDDGATVTWEESSLRLPSTGCINVPFTVTLPTNAGKPYIVTYVLITTPKAPEQIVGYGRHLDYMGGDAYFNRAPDSPVFTTSAVVCTDKLTSGFGPYNIRLAAIGGDRIQIKGILLNKTETGQLQDAIANGTLASITFNDGSVPPVAPKITKIKCKRKSTGLVRKFDGPKCPTGWVRVRRG